MLKKLRLKFICINMVIVTVMLCVILSLVLHSTRTNLKNESLRAMQSIAASPDTLIFGQPGEDESVRLPYFMLLMKNNHITIIGGDYYDLSDERMLRDILQAATDAREETGILEDYSLRYYRTTSSLGDVCVFADASGELATMQSLRTTCLIIGAVSFFVFLGLSFVLAKWAIKPVEQAWRQQRQFVSNASHELKTPLTVILTNAELLQAPEQNEERRAQFAQNILTMSRQMRGLTEELLQLARVDNTQNSVPLEPLDLSKLISDAVLPFEPLFFEKGMPFTANIEPNLTIKGSAAYLRQLPEILLDNAQKYAYPNTPVTLTLCRRGYSHCAITVSNYGDSLSPEDLKNIFKRFYRADKARAMNHSYGLGLPIAESIAAMHHGTIHAQSANGLNTFIVELPL